MARAFSFLFVSDTHVGHDDPVRPRPAGTRRGPDFWRNFQRALDLAAAERVAFVVHGGDLFYRSRVPQIHVDRAYGMIHEFLATGIPFYLVPGNHERSRLPPSLFMHHELLRVFHGPHTFLQPIGPWKVAVGGMPFIRENLRERFLQDIRQSALTDTPAHLRLLCLHQAIEGARVGPKEYVFHQGPDVLAKQDLPESVDALLVGHIHRRQIHFLGKSTEGFSRSIIYSGSSERTSMAEMNEPKGCYLIHAIRAGEESLRLDAEFVEFPTRRPFAFETPEGATLQDFSAWWSRQRQAVPAGSWIRLRVPAAWLEQKAPVLRIANLRSGLPGDTVLDLMPQSSPQDRLQEESQEGNRDLHPEQHEEQHQRRRRPEEAGLLGPLPGCN